MLLLSGLSGLYADSVPFVTYEGDNSVLMQLVAKEVLKIFNKIREGKEEQGEASFFNSYGKVIREEEPAPKPLKCGNPELLQDLQFIWLIMERFILVKVGECVLGVKSLMMEKGIPIKTVWNEHLQKDMIEMSTIFIEAMNYKLALNELDVAVKGKLWDKECVDIMIKLLNIYGLEFIKRHKTQILLKGSG